MSICVYQTIVCSRTVEQVNDGDVSEKLSDRQVCGPKYYYDY